MGYYAERILQAAITLLGGLFIAYALYRLMPGGPMQAIIASIVQRQVERGEHVQADVVADRAQRMTGINPEEGIIEGFYNYIYGIIVHQEFGRSIAFSEPAFDILFRVMPWSVLISGYGLLFGFLTTLLVGALMAWKEGTKLDSGLTVLVLTISSIPYYIFAIFMLIVFGFQWGILPTGGRYPPTADPGFNMEFMIGVVSHASMPIMTTFFVAFAGGALHMRANTVRIMGEEYLRSARIRGVSTNRILTRYLTRNAVLPMYTGLMIGIAGVFSSNVIVEVIFSYQAVGWFTLEALLRQDYPLLMAAFVFFASITVVAILVADLTYGLIDPRAGSAADREAY